MLTKIKKSWIKDQVVLVDNLNEEYTLLCEGSSTVYLLAIGNRVMIEGYEMLVDKSYFMDTFKVKE